MTIQKMRTDEEETSRDREQSLGNHLTFEDRESHGEQRNAGYAPEEDSQITMSEVTGDERREGQEGEHGEETPVEPFVRATFLDEDEGRDREQEDRGQDAMDQAESRKAQADAVGPRTELRLVTKSLFDLRDFHTTPIGRNGSETNRIPPC